MMVSMEMRLSLRGLGGCRGSFGRTLPSGRDSDYDRPITDQPLVSTVTATT